MFGWFLNFFHQPPSVQRGATNQIPLNNTLNRNVLNRQTNQNPKIPKGDFLWSGALFFIAIAVIFFKIHDSFFFIGLYVGAIISFIWICFILIKSINEGRFNLDIYIENLHNRHLDVVSLLGSFLLSVILGSYLFTLISWFFWILITILDTKKETRSYLMFSFYTYLVTYYFMKTLWALLILLVFILFFVVIFKKKTNQITAHN